MSFPSPDAITAFPKRIEPKTASRFEGKFACYSLVPICDIAAFLKAANQDDVLYDGGWPDAYLTLPPKYDFRGRSMADIVDYHVKFTSEQSSVEEYENLIDSTIFVVAIHEDYDKHGVLVVDLTHMSLDTEEHIAAVARCPLDAMCRQNDSLVSAIAWCVNISISNMGTLYCIKTFFEKTY